MRKRIRDLGLIQFGSTMQPEQRVSYGAYNAGDGPQPVVCLRCADGPPAVPAAREVCGTCLAAVWLSRTTEAAMTHMRQPVIVCTACLATTLKEEQP
jgi:hypothetical protein